MCVDDNSAFPIPPFVNFSACLCSCIVCKDISYAEISYCAISQCPRAGWGTHIDGVEKLSMNEIFWFVVGCLHHRARTRVNEILISKPLKSSQMEYRCLNKAGLKPLARLMVKKACCLHENSKPGQWWQFLFAWRSIGDCSSQFGNRSVEFLNGTDSICFLTNNGLENLSHLLLIPCV